MFFDFEILLLGSIILVRMYRMKSVCWVKIIRLVCLY